MDEKRSETLQEPVSGSGIRRPRRRPGENRERLIQAGIVEFARHGYRGASTTEIAAAAEVPQPHVYTNFSTKQELFLECVARAVTLVSESDGDAGATGVDECAAVVLQAVAALGESELRPMLQYRLDALRERLGEAGLDALLVRGARTLLSRD